MSVVTQRVSLAAPLPPNEKRVVILALRRAGMTLEQAKTAVKRGVNVGSPDGVALARRVSAHARNENVVRVDPIGMEIDPTAGGTSGAV